MSRPVSAKIYFWIGLIALTVLFGLYYIYFINGVARGMRLMGRHVIKFLFILAAYGVGVFALRRCGARWMTRLWHLSYLFTMSCLIVLGLYDWVFSRVSPDGRLLAGSLQDFLISPVFYFALTVIGGRLGGWRNPSD
jgi:hypothetical protein